MLTEEVNEMLTWWSDWKRLGCFPWAGGDINTQPALVYDVLTLCETVHAEIQESLTENG